MFSVLAFTGSQTHDLSVAIALFYSLMEGIAYGGIFKYMSHLKSHIEYEI